MTREPLPRRFGKYILTAALGEDALGHEYRALRVSEGEGFVRLHLLDSPEVSADALIDAIEENGEVHGFLKNPAIARGVDMDAADGVPYIAWNEANGRTLQNLLIKCRNPPRKIPIEHALLIAEKVATALDHAFNTTIDGDRTLHGLVWPRFVAISDDGEIRLVGFGLAEGVLPSLARPRLTREIAPYLAPEEKEQKQIGKNSDVFSVGAMLLELLTGQPAPVDPLGTLRGTAGNPPPPILPEIHALLRMTLGPAESRYASSGDLRRELGKLLFSGPYSPSTFNLAYFLNDLFRDEIEAEARARNRESTAGSPAAGSPAAATASRPDPPRRRVPAPPAAPAPSPAAPAARPQRAAPKQPAASRGSRGKAIVWIGGLIAAAALALGIVVFVRRPQRIRRGGDLLSQVPLPTATFLPEFIATPIGPTDAMSEGQFRDEVSRRLALEVQKLEAKMQSRPAGPRPKETVPPAALPAAGDPTRAAQAAPSPTAPEPTSIPTPMPAAADRIAPTASPAPTRALVREGSLIALEDADSPPRILKIVKPAYPPLALRARIGGIVLLRVLVSEHGAPLQVEVMRGAPAGLTEAAVDSVRRWTFDPARKAGLAMRTWMVIPIPFEP
ncbi:MAG: TonB family protein [Acidobacteriota bacterium]